MKHIIVVLDRSGSMESVKSATIEGFNALLFAQKKLDQPAKFTLVQFDDQYETVYQNVDIREARGLTEETFVPRGGTALLDAVGKTIVANKKDMDVLFVIVTDGHENQSREYNINQINDLISHYRKMGWEFTFIGANQDAISTACKLGISQQSALTYSGTGKTTSAAFNAVSRQLHTNRVSGQSINYSASDRHEAMADSEFLTQE